MDNDPNRAWFCHARLCEATARHIPETHLADLAARTVRAMDNLAGGYDEDQILELCRVAEELRTAVTPDPPPALQLLSLQQAINALVLGFPGDNHQCWRSAPLALPDIWMRAVDPKIGLSDDEYDQVTALIFECPQQRTALARLRGSTTSGTLYRFLQGHQAGHDYPQWLVPLLPLLLKRSPFGLDKRVQTIAERNLTYVQAEVLAHLYYDGTTFDTAVELAELL